jgi:hypothetical protein
MFSHPPPFLFFFFTLSGFTGSSDNEHYPIGWASNISSLFQQYANFVFLPSSFFVLFIPYSALPGELVIIPIQGRDLPNRERFGKQDPFILFKLGNVAKRSTTDIRGGQRPRWKDDQVGDKELLLRVGRRSDHRIKLLRQITAERGES